MDDLSKGLYNFVAAQTVATETIDFYKKALIERYENDLKRQLGFGINRKQKKEIDKKIEKELILLEKVIRQKVKDDNKFIKHFDTWTETKTLEYKVDGVYDCLDKLEEPKKETKETRIKWSNNR